MVAAQLVSNAILEIRYYAGQGPEHLARIHELADIVHNLPPHPSLRRPERSWKM
jgi:hypothetical protein